MEDEKCDVGLVSSCDVSVSPVIVNLPSETVSEVIESDKQVESYGERDVGEVMVEVVGSDVFVDGVSGHKERVLGPGEVWESQVHVWVNQDLQSNVNASCEENISKVDESKRGSVADEAKHVTEKQDLSMVESVNSGGSAVTGSPFRGVEVLDEGVGNHAMEATPIFSSTMVCSTAPLVEAMEQTSVVVNKEMMSDDNTLDKDCGIVMSGSDKSIDRGGGVVSKEDTLLFCNSTTPRLDLMGADSVTSHNLVNAGASYQAAPSEALHNSNCDGPESVRVDGFDGVVEEVGLVNTSTIDPSDYAGNNPDNSVDLNLIVSASGTAVSISGGEVVADTSSKGEVSWANVESIGANGDDSKDTIVNEKVVSASGAAASISCGEVVADISSKGEVSWANAEIIDGNGNDGKDAKVNEKEVAAAGEREHLIQNLDTLEPNVQDGMRCEATRGIRGISHSGLESSQEYFFASKEQEVAGVDIDGVLEFKNGDSSCTKNQEYPKLDGDRETGVVQHDLIFLNEPILVAFGVSSPEINKDKGIEIRIPSDMEDNLQNAENSSHVGEGDILEAGSDRYTVQPTIDFPDSEVLDDGSVAILQEKVVVQTESSKNDMDIDEADVAKTCISDLATSDVEVHKLKESGDCSGESNVNHITEGHTSEEKAMDVEEREIGEKHSPEEVDYSEPELGTDETASESENSKFLIEEPVKSAGLVRMGQPGYLTQSGNEGQFSLSDLVWGKVRSYPWWPGQIFDPSDASEKAVKYCKKDSYLVAYFGDRTFAWNDASVLKPFRPHFSLIEKQSNSEAFQNAVNCALEEVSRRVELGLACSCVPKDAYDKIKIQVVENTGIHKESSQREGMDKSCRVASFEPNELLEYVEDLAPCASSGARRLDLFIARAQLSAFCCFKGYRLPTEFPSSGELLENVDDDVEISDEMVVSRKRKHIPKDSLQSRKERSLTELIGDVAYSPDYDDEPIAKDMSKSILSTSGKKRKSSDPLADGSDKKASAYAAKVSTSTNQTPKPSFKIGECIRRVASQLTSSTSMGKSHNDDNGNDGSLKIYENTEKQSAIDSAESSLNEMLSQLQLLAQDPNEKPIFLNKIIAFFSSFRRSITLNRRKKKKTATTDGGSVEEFEFDDVNDSYWTDRIIQNYSEDQLLNNCENGTENLQVVPFAEEKSVKSGRKPHSRKRFSTSSYQTATAELDENVKRRKQESSPAELILNFVERNRVPSEINLNKMFRRFGPLMESETEVDHETGRAKVIFKRGSDAEVAHSSAIKFNIFGSMHVNYEIGYSPVISVKILPLSVPQCQEDPTVMI